MEQAGTGSSLGKRRSKSFSAASGNQKSTVWWETSLMNDPMVKQNRKPWSSHGLWKQINCLRRSRDRTTA